MLFAAPVFRERRLEAWARALMAIDSVLSLLGLIGVPLANMQVRLIGVACCVGFSLAVFTLLALIFSRTGPRAG